MQDYFIGLDIGTSNIKAVAFSRDGQFLNKKTSPCRPISPAPGWQEQDPEAIFTAVVKVLRKLIAENGQPHAIAFSCAMHSLIAVDETGQPLTRCILWSDTRSAAIAGSLKGSPAGKEIYRATGTPIHAMSPLPKIAWLKESEPLIFQKISKFLGIKEYLNFRLFGEYFTDYSIASATGLFDSRNLEWFAPALDFAGISPQQLPHPVPPFFILKNLNLKILRQIGLTGETPFVIGASDGCLSNLGAGAIGGGEAAMSIGTSGAIRMTTLSPSYDPQERIFNYLLTENQYVTGGASNNGAVVYEWFTRQFFGVKPAAGRMAKHLKSLSEVPAGSDGLLFLPYLLGERAPVWNASAQGVFFGVTAKHTSAHFHRAVLEGVLLNLCLIGQVLEETVAPVSRILADGGFTKMDFWVQMAADVFGKEIQTFESEDTPALGAVLMAMKSLGYIENFHLVKNTRRPLKTFHPNPDNHRIYQQSLENFKEIYRLLERKMAFGRNTVA